MERATSGKYKVGIAMRASIIAAGLDLWKMHGSKGVTANAIGEKLGKTPPSILYHFGYKIDELRNAVAEHAIEQDCASVILQLINADHPAVKILPADKLQAFHQMM